MYSLHTPTQPSIIPRHLKHLHSLLPKLDISTLLRVARLFDPSLPTIRPLLVKANSHRQRWGSLLPSYCKYVFIILGPLIQTTQNKKITIYVWWIRYHRTQSFLHDCTIRAAHLVALAILLWTLIVCLAGVIRQVRWPPWSVVVSHLVPLRRTPLQGSRLT